MNYKFLITISLIYCFTLSCKKETTQNLQDTSNEILFESAYIDKIFFEKIGDSYRLTFKGDFKNLSIRLFDEVYTTLDVEFVLNDDRIITQKDYKSGYPYAFGDLEKGWKPGETRSIGDKNVLISDFIPEHYRNYPIKQVLVVFRLDCDDLINNESIEYYSIIEVTQMWNKLN